MRQDITGCVLGATYQIAGWMRGNSELYSTCTVKVSPTASTNWATAIDLNPPQTYTGNAWQRFSGTVVATGTSMTLWLDGQTGSTGLNKAECFDSVTVTCVGSNGAASAGGQAAGNKPRLQLADELRQLRLDRHHESEHCLERGPPSPTVVNGTNFVTNAISGQSKFYRLMRP